MTAHTIARPRDWTRWQRHLAALAGVAAAMLAVFHRDAADMAGIWWHSSTFTHCLLMVPMIGWLVSQRTALLRSLTPAFWWPALVWIAGSGLVWLVGEAAGAGSDRRWQHGEVVGREGEQRPEVDAALRQQQHLGQIGRAHV